MDTKIFDRIEKKYLIDDTQRKSIIKQIKSKMEKDNYHLSKVFNVYYDTDNFDLIIQSIDKPLFKEKVRARSYAGYDKVFLEIKTKVHGKDNNIGYKRRVMVTKDDYKKFAKRTHTAVELAGKEIEEKTDLQIAAEIDYLVEYFDLKPKILLYYDRESFAGEDDLRITFDKDLKFRTEKLNFRQDKQDQYYFKNKKNTIMEIKANGAMPLWLVRILSKEKIYPTRFSKIGKIYELLRKEQNV